jgi:hypothetical protein
MNLSIDRNPLAPHDHMVPGNLDFESPPHRPSLHFEA